MNRIGRTTNVLTVTLGDRRLAFIISIVSLFVLTSMYIFFVQSSVYASLTAHRYGNLTSLVGSEISDLEAESSKVYMALSPESATDAGLVRVSSLTYVRLPGAGEVTYLGNAKY